MTRKFATGGAPWLGPAAALGLAGGAALLVAARPEAVGALFLAVGVAAALAAAWLWPGTAAVLWLFAVALTPDMWLAAFLGAGAGMAVVAGLKFAGIALVLLALSRHGARFDPFSPAWAFVAMFAWTAACGLHPALEMGESLRSLAGSVAPFLWFFLRWPAAMARAVRCAAAWLAPASVLLGAGLAVWGVHPLFVDQGGLRLQGAGHPAFLAAFAMVGAYAALLEGLGAGRLRWVLPLGLNLGILALSGARAPAAIAGTVLLAAVLSGRVPAALGAVRPALLAAAGLLALAAGVFAGEAAGLRLFQLLEGEAGHLSGRDEIWPIFAAAWDAAPILGWGVGTGKVLVPLDSLTARLLGTNAAHNEYLRIGVEGGYLGLTLLISLFLAWSVWQVRARRGVEGRIVLLVLIGFAVHSYTDNTLIATTSLVLFAWLAAVLAAAGDGTDGRERSRTLS